MALAALPAIHRRNVHFQEGPPIRKSSNHPALEVFFSTQSHRIL